MGDDHQDLPGTSWVAVSTLREQAAHFLAFFDQLNPLFAPDTQERANGVLFWRYFRAILGEVDTQLERRTGEGEELEEADIAEVVESVIAGEREAWDEVDDSPSLPEDHAASVLTAYAGVIEASIDEAFENLPVSPAARDGLHAIAGALVAKGTRNRGSPFHSRVVIAGFGSNEYFPSLFEFEMDTIALDRLKYAQRGHASISGENRALVRAFAQSEQVATFMEGIDEAVTEATLAYWHDELPSLVNAVEPGRRRQGGAIRRDGRQVRRDGRRVRGGLADPATGHVHLAHHPRGRDDAQG
jgi:hypothetical protein